MFLSMDAEEKNTITLPKDVPVYFELKSLMEVTGSNPGLNISFEGVYLAVKPAAKKLIVFGQKSGQNVFNF